MNYNDLVRQIKTKKSFLCIGLDSDYQKLPVEAKYTNQPVFEFNQRIIDATHDVCVAYKLNTAFYEARGIEGWKDLLETIQYIKTNYPELFVIADAKRGDIGNTSRNYAEAFFSNMEANAVTVAPYMGKDSVTPFLEYQGKWIILLALTSNPGADDFQYIKDSHKQLPLYKHVINTSKKWGSPENMMYVAGATRADQLKEIRDDIPEHFLLIPGIGAQGGSLKEVVENGMNKDCGLLVNSSRSIIFASDEGFDVAAREKALEMQQEMEAHLTHHHII
jgi:orotidine-5'-phosphate decarboxylase